MDRQSQTFRSSRSKLTSKQIAHSRIIALIVEIINDTKETADAEFLWSALSQKGFKMSISSFYNRLKEAVDAGLIEKIHIISNKFAYRALPSQTLRG
ncbi:hypothetical protein A0256_09685 [Mucilaginibacter sp. PAMC 26640]|nr:hypothetical protein A0256_09685 [Mucilaginibacter sp. PAMC 26640]